jgi:hypothetical protein
MRVMVISSVISQIVDQDRVGAVKREGQTPISVGTHDYSPALLMPAILPKIQGYVPGTSVRFYTDRRNKVTFDQEEHHLRA